MTKHTVNRDQPTPTGAIEENKMTWVRKGNGYYMATGYSGIVVAIIQDAAGRTGRLPRLWHVYAGDSTAKRTSAHTLREAKVKAEGMFS